MPANKADTVPERQQFCLDGVDQCRLIAIREIGPADRTAEQHIADDGKLPWFVHQYNATRAMTRTMVHVERGAGDGQCIAFRKPSIWHHVLYVRYPKAAALADEVVE